MRSAGTQTTLTSAALLCYAVLALPCAADTLRFDRLVAGGDDSSFAWLSSSHGSWVGQPATSVPSCDDLCSLAELPDANALGATVAWDRGDQPGEFENDRQAWESEPATEPWLSGSFALPANARIAPKHDSRIDLSEASVADSDGLGVAVPTISTMMVLMSGVGLLFWWRNVSRGLPP